MVDLFIANRLPVNLGKFISGFVFMGVALWLTYGPRFQKSMLGAEAGLLNATHSEP